MSAYTVKNCFSAIGLSLYNHTRSQARDLRPTHRKQTVGLRCMQSKLSWRKLILFNFDGQMLDPQSALEFCPIHCPNGRLGQDLGFGEFAFVLELPELLNRKLAAVRAKLGQS